jgi:hypothetical protein
VWCLTALTAAGSPALAQVTPAAGYTPPDDTPVIRIGATIFADYTFQTDPKGTDVDGNPFSPNSFNVGRADVNVKGNIQSLRPVHRLSRHPWHAPDCPSIYIRPPTANAKP